MSVQLPAPSAALQTVELGGQHHSDLVLFDADGKLLLHEVSSHMVGGRRWPHLLLRGGDQDVGLVKYEGVEVVRQS